MGRDYEDSSSFFNGLSDLWTRFFREKDQLKAVYRANEILMGQIFLELMEDVLSLSIREAPVFRKEFFRLLVVREDLVEFDATLSGYRLIVSDDALKECDFLYNKIYNPTVVLENPKDFSMALEDEDYLVFKDDPFNWGGSGDSIPGVPYRYVEVEDSSGNISQVKELAFWIPDARVDGFDLYLKYGHMLGRFEPSSEAYRALIYGVVRYFVVGAATEILKSVLNSIVGYPVIRDDGEVLEKVDTDDLDNQIVITDKARYVFPESAPLRSDILKTSNWSENVGKENALSFSAFEALTTAFDVEDTVSKPTWWYGLTIPKKLAPDSGWDRRNVDMVRYENNVNNPTWACVGDPGIYCGADDDGYIPVANPPTYPAYGGTSLWRPTYRFSFGTQIFELLMKNYCFLVDMDDELFLQGDLPYGRLRFDLENIIFAGKPAYTYMFPEPEIELDDQINLDDDAAELEVNINNNDTFSEKLVGLDNVLRAGSTGLQVGDAYRYDKTAGNEDQIIITHNMNLTVPDSNGNTPLAAGGSDPTKTFRSPVKTIALADSGQAFGSHYGYVDRGWNPSLPFEESDVGSWIEDSFDNKMYKIMKVENAGRVLVVPVPPTGIGDRSWSIYVDTGGFVDYPIEITIT